MLSEKITQDLTKASWIRAMFEEGEKLKKIHGAENVFDFTLGNPDTEPPTKVKETLIRLISENNVGMHRYMNNAGFFDVREKIAQKIQIESGISISVQNIIMTCGAAGGLNVVLKTVLNPNDEVIIFSPYFAEYRFYIENHGGTMVVVPTAPDTFEPDLRILKQSISKNTKAIIINSPNNPTGAIYGEDTLTKMSEILESAQKEFSSDILVISDEPYTQLVYDNATVPSILKIFKNAVIVNSFSKSLSLPGERIGYIATSSRIKNVELLMSGMVFANRTLGFVNAPALFQKVIGMTIDQAVDVSEYKIRRDKLYDILTDIGFSCLKPKGAFYLFPKCLIDNDIEFVKHAVKYNLLLVPGTGFGYPGYFRIAYCVSMKTIEDSVPAFKALYMDFKG